MKKIALSAFVIAASGAYVLAQPGEGKPSDILGVARPADNDPTGSIPARTAEAIPEPQRLPLQPLTVPAAVPAPASEADDEDAAPATVAERETDDEAVTVPSVRSRAFREPPSDQPAIAAAPSEPAAEPDPPPMAAAPAQPSPPPPAAEPSPPPAPATAALAIAHIPLPRPRPEYRVTKASATPAIVAAAAGSGYADGTYTGPAVDAYYGLVQVQAVVQGRRLVNIQVLRYPSDRRTSVFINRHALPLLRDEVIRAQSARVDIVSGATLTSRAFMRSLDAALRQANA